MKTVVLVVDPHDDTRALYRESFERNGCEVVEASDGREALTHALQRPPTLVVTETVLPFIDGYALCQILRRDQATTDVPILVVTGDARASELSRAFRSGASALLVKPTTAEQIWTETRRLIADDMSVGASATDSHGPTSAERDPSISHRASRSKIFSRFTTATPAVRPPALLCPSCDRPLVYEHSYVGGVSERHREQWDRYVCPTACGAFEYRQRTRNVRHLE
jgi:CheY-like chemotaxis protein